MSAPARARWSFATRTALFALALSCCIPDQDEPLCLGGSTECGRRCVSLAIDPGNCGACGAACGAGEVCREGACGAPCGAGLTMCDGHCVELGADPAHCGACGAACEAKLVCVDGACADDCFGDSLRCGDVCVDKNASHEHCGGCDTPCAPEEACIKGKCEPACVDGLACGAVCVDGDTDGANCGVCGHACLAGRACVGGECEPYCGPKPCDGCEAWWATAWPVDGDTTGTPGTKAVATGPDGRIFVAVDFVGEATFGAQMLVTPNGFTDIAVMELDPEGGVVWVQQIGGNGAERARGLAVVDAGRLVLTGDFGGTLTVGAQVLTSAGAQDGFVAALSSSGGAPFWATQLASTGADRIGPVAATATEIVVGGAYGAQATLVSPGPISTVLPAPFGKDDAFLARLDPLSGKAIWATGFGADQDDSIEDIVLSPGSVFVAGAIARDNTAMVPAPVIVQVGGFTLTLTAKMGGLIAAFSESSGEAEWATLLSNESPALNTSQAHASTLARAPDGTLWMLGRFAGTLSLDSPAGSTAASWDAVLVHLDPAAGIELGAWPFGGIGSEFPFDLAIDDAGRIVATGSFNGVMKLGELGPKDKKLVATPAMPATTDIWLASFDPTSPPTMRCARSFGDEATQAPSSLSLLQGVAYLGGRLIGTIEVEPAITVSASAGATSAFVAAFGY